MQNNKKIKWLIYTVAVGLIPFIARFMVFLFTPNKDLQQLINASEVVAFGLVLQISNLNELEHWINYDDRNWKTIHNGIAIIFIVLLGLLYAFSLLADTNPQLYDIGAIKIAALSLSIVSFFLSYSIFDRLSKAYIGESP